MQLVMRLFGMFLPFIFYALNLMSKESSANDNCEGKPFNCCEGFTFDVQTNRCKECELGFFGVNCSSKCPSPTYGRHCQSKCSCNQSCHHVSGCDLVSKIITRATSGNEKSIQTSEKSTSRRSVFDEDHFSPVSKPTSNRLHGLTNSKPNFNQKSSNIGMMNHGLYAIVISNTLLTLPVTVVVLIFICRKFKKRKKKIQVEEGVVDDNDPCYNDLNEINTCVKTSEYDALSNCTEQIDGTSTTSLDCLSDGPIQRKARENSYVPVKEKKAKENDETIHNKDIYARVKRNQSLMDYVPMGESITTEDMNNDATMNDTQSVDESLYIVPLLPSADEPGIHIKSLKSPASISSTDVEERENTDKEGNIYTDLM